MSGGKRRQGLVFDFQSSAMINALEYAQAQMPGLSVYLEDGRVEIDNNLVENAIRPAALGKKNWLFIGEEQAGERSAIIYTVIPTPTLKTCSHGCPE